MKGAPTKRRTTIKIACAALAVVSAAAPASQARAQDNGRSVLRRVARYLVDTGAAEVRSPIFMVKGRVLTYYLGDVLAIDPSAMDSPEAVNADTSAILFPLEDQIRVELIRSVIEAPEMAEFAFLKDAIAHIEGLIDASLVDLASQQYTGDALVTRLRQRNQDALSKLDAAVRDHAKKHHLGSLKMARIELADTYRVGITTDPTGGTIRYVGDFAFRAATKQSSEPAWLNWSTDGPTPLKAGTYRFRVVWPASDGRTPTFEDTIDVSSPASIVLRPSPEVRP